jgi:Leucine-rich repeat (LRR) protein
LEKLDVGKNKITEIKSLNNSGEISITSLMIDNNDLTELCKIKQVEKLYLSRNRRLDYSKVTFNCWSKLTHLNLAETSLKNLKHDYRMLHGCNKLVSLDISYNNLEMLRFEHFPILSNLTNLNIRNNSLINLDVVELRRKFQALSWILIAGKR